MRSRHSILAQSGYSLVEVLAVLAVLGICLTAGLLAVTRGLDVVQARGAAQAWQAASTAAQQSAVWSGVAEDVTVESGRISVAAVSGGSDADLGLSLPLIPVLANVSRWQRPGGASVRFSAGTGAPNSAGSLYFLGPGGDFRVAVRLESGLTTRTRTEAP